MTDTQLLDIFREARKKTQTVDQAAIMALRRVRTLTVDQCAQKLIDARDYGHSAGMAEIIRPLL